MNIVYLIGNGFDLNLGLPTMYSQFFEYYEQQPSKNDDVVALKKDIAEQPKNWSNLEIGLGNYVHKISTQEKIDLLHKDLINGLSLYLKKVEDNYTCDDSEKNKIYEFLLNPEYQFLYDDKSKIEHFKQRFSNPWRTRVITFNYTKTLERLIGFKGTEIQMANNKLLLSIDHIHGTVEEGMVLGLNDESQLKNDEFKNIPLIKKKYIKYEYNKARRTGHDAHCQQWIADADLICLFGLSYGKTDLRWWEYIVKRLIKGNCRLIIFEHLDQSFSKQEIVEEQEKEIEIKENFINCIDLEMPQREAIMNLIDVRINSDMFKIDNSKFVFTPFFTKSAIEKCEFVIKGGNVTC